MNSLQFTSKNEFLGAGLGDGIVKVWELTRKEVVRQFKSSSHNSKICVNQIKFSPTNDLLGAATNQGSINIFPVADMIA